MTLINNYVSLAEVKAVLNIPTADTADDSRLETVIMAVCRQIDAFCGRRFYTTTSAETRAYTPDEYDVFYCPDDINSVTSLKTDTDGDGVYETTWDTTDYKLRPTNASLDGEPYTYITTTPDGDYTFPSSIPNSLQIVGKFGWGSTASAPYQVRQAALIQVQRIFRREDAPFGVVGSGEFGTVTAITDFDPDVKNLLMGVSRRV